MASTFIMSYPAPADDDAPLREWLELCDEITRAGGRIFVIDPPELSDRPQAPLPGLVYAASLGALFPQAPGGATFLLSAEPAAYAAPVLERAGLRVVRAEGPFAGQVDVAAVGSNRFILTYAGAAGLRGLAQVRELLPPGARVLEFALRPGVRCGSQCLGAFTSAANHSVLLVHPGGLEGCALEGVQSFVGSSIEVIPIGTEDAMAQAAEALCVRGHLMLPTGLSSFLRGVLVRHGFWLKELHLPALLRGGAGPRSLVNELPGFVISDEAPSYALRREELHRLLRRKGA